jgi:hypothetical protein
MPERISDNWVAVISIDTAPSVTAGSWNVPGDSSRLKLASQYPRPCAVTRIQLGQVSGGVIRAILFLSDRTWLGND